jgi:predicted esterase
MKFFGTALIFFALSLQACSTQEPKIQTGLNDSVRCSQVNDQLYAAYMPELKDKNEKIPALFMFDPAARAKSTVEQYKTLADKYKVALFCSYNSKNGSVDINNKAANAMINDALVRFPIDEQRIILSGFSGGSRFAYGYASQNQKVKGIIACGAFFPGNSNNLPKPAFNYSGLAGTFDFNFREGLAMRNQLIGENFPFQFIPFDGKHEWPTVESYERALVYQLSLCSGSQNMMYVCSTLEQQALKSNLDSANFINASWIYQNLMIMDKGQSQVYYVSLQKLLNSKEYSIQSKQFSKSLRMEDSISTELSDAAYGIMLTANNQFDKHKPTVWWKNKVGMLSKMEENSKDIYTRNSAKRINGQIGVMLWELNRKLMQQKFYNQSLELAEILLLLEPSNETYLALKAEVLYAQGKTDDAKLFYKQAKEKGFTLHNAFLGTSEIVKKMDAESL